MFLQRAAGRGHRVPRRCALEFYETAARVAERGHGPAGDDIAGVEEPAGEKECLERYLPTILSAENNEVTIGVVGK